MVMMKKSLALYDRDEKGELIPQIRTLEMSVEDQKRFPDYKGMEISITPLTRGELKRLFGLGGKDTDTKPDTEKDEDGEVILKHCHEPKFTKEELVHAKPVVVRSIIKTIFTESGVKFDEGAGKEKFDDEDDFGKN